MEDELTPASALTGLLAAMGVQGCTHEQRRYVADRMAEISLGPCGSVIAEVLNPQTRTVKAHAIGQHIQFTYPPANVPQSFRR